jgi:hypothetical protein
LCLSLGYLGVSRFLIVRFGAFQSFLTARRFLLSEEPRTVALVSTRDLDLKEKLRRPRRGGFAATPKGWE